MVHIHHAVPRPTWLCLWGATDLFLRGVDGCSSVICRHGPYSRLRYLRAIKPRQNRHAVREESILWHLKVDFVENRPVVVQLVRHIGEGSGVGSVVLNIEKQLIALGYVTERLTLEDTGLRPFRPRRSRIANKLLLMREVIWFSVAGTLLARRRYRKSNRHVVLCHGDPVFGDIFVNHGILKQAMRERKSTLTAIVRNPMHWFTLLRDEFRYATRSHQAIVSLTSTDEVQLQANYPQLRMPVRVISNGVDTGKFRPPTGLERTTARESVSLSDEQKCVLFVGHEFDRKGLYLLLDAVRLLPDEYIVHVVGGDQTMISSARAYSDELGVNRRVKFLGHVSDARDYYWAADLFCLPTAYETGPLVLLEALASGLPCLMTPVGLAPELVVDGLNGYIIPSSSHEIGERILLATADAENLNRMRTVSRESVLSFSWERIGRQYSDLILSVYRSRTDD